MSASLAVPFAHVKAWPDGLRDLLRDGKTVIGHSPCGASSSIRDVVTASLTRVAIVAGHEGDGLTREAMDACTHIARIPMAPGMDSLNVGTAVAIALYELAATDTRMAEATGSQTGKRKRRRTDKR